MTGVLDHERKVLLVLAVSIIILLAVYNLVSVWVTGPLRIVIAVPVAWVIWTVAIRTVNDRKLLE